MHMKNIEIEIVIDTRPALQGFLTSFYVLWLQVMEDPTKA